MKKIAGALVGVLLMGTSAIAAPWEGTVIAPGFGTYSNITEFDWSSAGSGAAIGLADPQQFYVGKQFDFLYQARLSKMVDAGGNDVNFNGWEMTLVAKIREEIIDIDYADFEATFQVVEPSSWYIYYDSTPDSVTTTGSGFDDGLLAASGRWQVGDQSSFDAIVPGGAGTGSFALRGIVDSMSSLYFDPASPFVIDINFFGTLQRPVGNSTTVSFFTDGSSTAYPTYAVTPEDLLFKADANTTNGVVPEPSTMLLVGAGLLGLVGISRKRSKK